MDVLVERYQRRKYVNQEDAPMLYYIRQKAGNVRVIFAGAGAAVPLIESFVEQLRLSLTQGDKVKIDGLGTFHITLTSDGTEVKKDCTVRSIRRVNVRFVADKALKLINSSHTSTQSNNNLLFEFELRVDGSDPDEGGSGSGSGGSGEEKPGGGGVTPDPSV